MIRAIGIVFLVLILALGFFWMKSVRMENQYIQSRTALEQKEGVVKDLKSKLDTSRQAYQVLSEQLLDEQMAGLKLREESKKLDQQLQVSLDKIRILEREDKEFHDWSNTPLPFSVVGLFKPTETVATNNSHQN